MTLSIGKVTEDPRKVDKTYASTVSLTGTLREECSVMDPTVLVKTSAASIAGCNYMYISEFGRYYFITDITAVSDTLSRVSGHCDVLNTYKAGIKSNTGIVKRSTSAGDPFINDGSMRVRTTKTFTPYMFGKQFTDYSYILVTI